MNIRERMLHKISGSGLNDLLFVPRLDIWYNANKAQGSLPAKYEDFTLDQILLDLELGYHSVIPDFTHTGEVADLYHRALGFYNHRDFPHYADFSNVEYEVLQSDKEIKVIYHTSSGEITTRMEYGAEFNISGLTIPNILEPAIKEQKDYAILEKLFSQVKIIPTPEQYNLYRKRVGERGLAVAYISLACGPVAHIMRDLRRYDGFFLDLYDYPETIESLGEVLGTLYNRMIDAAVATEAEVAILGSNYDEMLTVRPMFEKYFKPWLIRAGDQLHKAGKYLLTHTDGENAAINDIYLDCNFDIADSITPSPMTKISLPDYRNMYGSQITIWGGIPSLCMLKESMNYNDFKAHIDGIVESCKPYNNLILSIADTCPPQADFDRILYLCDCLNNHTNIF